MYHDKTPPLSIMKVLFRGLGCKYKQSGLSANADTVLTANSVKYENVIIGAMKRNTSDLELQKVNIKDRKQGVQFVLFFYLKLPNKN